MDDFIIKLGSVSSNKSSFFFKIKDTFFEDFVFFEFKNVDINVNVTLFKDLNKISLKLLLEGKINDVPCDLCNQHLSIDINCSTKLIIIYLQKNENSINLKQIIFELIVVNIPAKREHPVDKNGNSTCDKGMIELLNKYMPGKSKLSDPRWDALKNLK